MNQFPITNKGKILEILPQRDPILMVDTFYDCSTRFATMGFTVNPGSYLFSGRYLSESGVIEHIAQSAILFTKYQYYLNNEEPRLAHIGEITDLHISYLPKDGEMLVTTIEKIGEFHNLILIEADTVTESEIVANCQIKILLNRAFSW